MGIDMLTALLGKAPVFGLMTDEGCKVKWLIEVKDMPRLPHPEMVGSAIGLKVLERVGPQESLRTPDERLGHKNLTKLPEHTSVCGSAELDMLLSRGYFKNQGQGGKGVYADRGALWWTRSPSNAGLW